MASQADVRELDGEGAVSKKRRFDARDWDYIAEYVIETYSKRKHDRRDLEKQWKDIDRQVAMQPNIEFKKLPDGRIDVKKLWMSEIELPLQAQALEVLTADARRLAFAGDPWFRAHSEVTDKYLETVDFTSIVLGDESGVPSKFNQDNADKLVHGFLSHLFDQSDFYTRYDKIDAEAFKYGMGVGRGRKETKNIYIHESRGVRKEKQRIPVLVPCSIKSLYLDTPKPTMHSAQELGLAHIAVDYIKLENLHLAANRGSNDPDDEDGGWMPANLKKVKPDKDGYVKVLEMEGDIVVPRKTTRSMVIPGAIVTVVLGSEDGGSASRATVRFRFRKSPFSSYLLFPYHYESTDEAYPTSPLMKGRPVQIMATDAVNRLLDSAALKACPPVSYDRSDQQFIQSGGPVIHPYAQWSSNDPNSITAHVELGGDPGALSGALTLAINLYAELTGVLPARIGAQTKSHTTAFAKGQEIERGATRTVDFVNSSGEGPMTRWLDMAYQMGRDALGKNEEITFYIASYGGYVKVTKEQLPERANFEWLGGGGPADEQVRMQKKLQALATAVQMDQLAAQRGEQPNLNIAAAQAEVLREAGWTDLDAILNLHQSVGGIQTPPGQAIAALQQLNPQAVGG